MSASQNLTWGNVVTEKQNALELLSAALESFERGVHDLESVWTPDRLAVSAGERKGDTAACVLRLKDALEQASLTANSILVSGQGSAFSPYAADHLRSQIEAVESALAAGPTSDELGELQARVARFDAIEDELTYLRTRAKDLGQLENLELEQSQLETRVEQLTLALQESGVGEVESQARVICAKVGATVSELESVLTDRLKELTVKLESGSRRLASLLQDLETNRQRLDDAVVRYNEILPDAQLHAEANAKIAAAIGTQTIVESVETISTALRDTDLAIKEALEIVENGKKLPELAVGT